MKKGTVFVLSGPAGSGKSTVRETLMSRGLNFHYSVSDTTRKPRAGGVNGVDYNFITREEFEEGIARGDYYEHAKYTGEYYGTPVSQLEPYIESGVNVILEIEVDGAMQVKKRDKNAVLVMLLPPSYSCLEARLRGRGTETEEKIRRRLARARAEVMHFDKYDYFLLNEDDGVEACVRQLEIIAEAQSYRTGNYPDFPTKFFNT
jgi:guanylate kinase